MRMPIFFLALLTATSTSLAAVQPTALHPVPGDAQDLVLFLDARPYLIRLHLQINGRSFRQNWDETVEHLFRYLDADGDGALNEKELALAPSRTQWVQLMTGTSVEPDGAPEMAELTGDAKQTKASRAQFLRYYLNSGAGALQIEWGWRGEATDALSNALFQHLDKDKDGNLSKAELSAAAAVLQTLDTNGDELIQGQELNPPRGGFPVFTYRTATDKQPVPKSFPFVILPPDAKAEAMAAEMLRRYDHNKDRQIDPKEWPLDKAAFALIDADGDGRLSAAELAEWRKLPPDLDLIAPLAPGGPQDIRILPEADGKPNRLTALLPPSRDGALRIPLAEKQLELVRHSLTAKLHQELLKQFDALAGANGVLNEKKIYQPPFTFVAMLRLADRNNDNRLTRKELTEYLQVQEKFLFRTSYLTVVDRGSSLYEFLDADHDRRLSPRELRTAWKRLSVWDCDKTGRIARRQVPRQFQFVLSYGHSRAGLPDPQPGRPDDNMSLFRDRSRGPLWFRKMDRNGDGDVSQAEFLGTAEQFQRLDADGDGLIDAAEAERADKKGRKSR
jgi:Ca2+-binding EF-hand superfamily protein